MKRTDLIPALALVGAITLSGTMVATAQNLPATGDAPQAGVKIQPIHGEGKGGFWRNRHDDDDDDHRRFDRSRFGGREGHGDGAQMMLKLFAQIDADDNGEVTQAEIDAYRSAQISGADASGDGNLSIEEFDTLYRAFTRERMVDAFQRLDDDGDGQITPAELDLRLDGVVERMDRNGDGVLTIQDRRGRRG